ncbi:MAG TPA: adenine phosphoribosyltransferase [Methylophaga aminisulfidivorans]|uniref:Adenine phosphoribosyltransferase n=2 Tax=root TaxID=1 RepID=A0A7C1W5N7_9GAMM|nr:adenine phosphoribosyltransferase [Methylophaga aminisulfidivorans]
MDKLKSKIQDVHDFPKPGVLFKDISPLLEDGPMLKECVKALAEPFIHSGVTIVAGMEARGFIFGSLVAYELGLGFVPLRKPGKLPREVYRVNFELEYGQATLESHIDAIKETDRVLIIDDVLATGGTAKASCELVEQHGAEVVACAFVMELSFLQGRQKITDYLTHSLIRL